MKERLTKIIELAFGGNKASFARQMGITAQQLNSYISGKSNFGAKMRDRLESLGISYKYVLQGEGSPFTDNPLGFQLQKRYGDDMGAVLQSKYNVYPTSNPAPRNVPVMLSTVQAGMPKWVSDSIGAEIDISKLYHENSYYVIARGDSMTGARIEEGDWLLVDESKQAMNNDIVIALVNAETTVKRLKTNGVSWLLHPSSDNEKHKPIEVNDSVQIIGVVVQIIIQ
jgi:DNA polymerase V